MKQEIEIDTIKFSLLKEAAILSLVGNSTMSGLPLALLAFDYRHLLCENEFNLRQFENVVIYPDSTGIFLLMRLFYSKESAGFGRIVSTNLHFEMLNLFNNLRSKIFLLGDTEETLQRFIKKVNSDYPDISIVGWRNGFKQDTIDKTAEEINKARPEVLLVGMGVPKQEIILTQLAEQIEVPVKITVGAFFSFYSGVHKRAPAIFQKLYLEWFYRLMQEPGRLAKRYFVQLPKAFLRMAKIKNGNRNFVSVD